MFGMLRAAALAATRNRRARAGVSSVVQSHRQRRLSVLLTCASALGAASAMAQELTPRAYWPTPVGTDVFILAYQRNTGDILVDPSLPVTGVDSDIDYYQLAYQRSLDIFGRSASVQVSQPYADGATRGFVEGEFRQRITTGLGDTRLRLAVNLKGAPAMDAAQFGALRNNPVTIIGASLIVQAPTGDYEADRFINISTNRWAVKPAVGAIFPLRPTWLLEAEIGVWLFGDNDNYVGATRKQDEIVSAEMHLVKRVRPGFWISLDANYYAGGETRVGPIVRDDLQRNSRAGFTIVYPFRNRHALRGSYSTGVSTRSGGDFEILSLAYLYAW